jgi:hypothetical protein
VEEIERRQQNVTDTRVASLFLFVAFRHEPLQECSLKFAFLRTSKGRVFSQVYKFAGVSEPKFFFVLHILLIVQ